MPETTYETTRGETRLIIHGVPTVFAENGDELGFDLRVMRDLDQLIEEALAGRAEGETALELQYRSVSEPPDPVSVELRRALRARHMTGAQVAQKLNVSPPVVSRWLSPSYHQHGVDTLRRIAEVLDMDVEIRLIPRERRTA